MAPAPKNFPDAAAVKQACMDELTRSVSLAPSGLAEAEKIYAKTVERLVDPRPGEGWGAQGLARFNMVQVSGYAFRAISRIADEAIQMSGGAPVEDKDLQKAARVVIKEFRKRCPKEIERGTVIPIPKQAHGDLCSDFA